jgi:HTH-type transcriptional regulator, glycine betaine synthesis regulator
MDETLQAVRDSVIRGLGQLTDFFGFSPVMGHLYGALLMSPEPLSLDELEAIVAKSKASVSMTMQALERWGMVRQVWVKGDRRKFYESESDLWKIVTNVIESRERREVGVALNILEDNAKRLEVARLSLTETDRKLADHYLAQVKRLQAFFQIAQMALELLLARGGPPDLTDITSASHNETGHRV